MRQILFSLLLVVTSSVARADKSVDQPAPSSQRLADRPPVQPLGNCEIIIICKVVPLPGR